jgi:hypothetical protein
LIEIFIIDFNLIKLAMSIGYSRYLRRIPIGREGFRCEHAGGKAMRRYNGKKYNGKKKGRP